MPTSNAVASSNVLHRDIPYEVLISMQRIMSMQDSPEGDPLDNISPTFDPVPTLNNLFPDEASLVQIDAVRQRLADDERALRGEISTLRAELDKSHDPQRMQSIQEMISELLGQMSRIREKATESEAVVKNITKDIQRLDLAKKNLMLSMTTLKRFQMLANALGQLEEYVNNRKYAEISQTLAAVKELSQPFKAYLSTPRVAQTWSRIQSVQGELRSKLDEDFDAFFVPDPSKPIRQSTISNACLVVDVFGEDYRSQLIDRYCTIELKEYRRIFRITDEAGHLDNLSRRFAFFRRLLQTHDAERGKVFPELWRVGQVMCAKFMDITRDDILQLLEKAGTSLTVTLLLQCLQHSLDFEAFVSRKYSQPLVQILQLSTSVPSSSRSLKSLSSAFDLHMGVFIDAQDKALADMLAPHRGKKVRSSLDSPQPSNVDPLSNAVVLPSSTELFYFYAQILEQCSKLFTGKPLYDLSCLMKKWLRVYSEDVLLPALKRLPSQTRRSMDSRFDIDELKNACLIVNTAEYCQATAIELEDRIRDKVSDEFKEQVTFQQERDSFIGIVSSAIFVMLWELEKALEGHFETMTRTLWTNIEDVSGPSAYVKELTESIDHVVEIVSPLIEQKKYLRNFFDKAAALIISRFTNALVRSRPLKEVGAEQLLLDLQAIRACLLKLPGEPSTTSVFAKGVMKSTTKIETLLKTIIPPADPPEGFIVNYTLLIGDASFSNFQKILDLKGTPRAEQNSLLDLFLTVTSTKPELESTSFLSSVDMDPQPQSSGSLISPIGSRVHLPSLLANASSSSSTTESILGVITTPPVGSPPPGSANEAPLRGGDSAQRREVFSDLRRLVSFGLRRDSTVHVPP